jgi:capsular exopolysaccharide synthesis family protein
VVVVATVAAFVFSAAQPSRYRAAAKLENIAPFTDTTQLSLELSGVNTTITSSGLLDPAAAQFGGPLPGAADFTISAAPAPMVGDRAATDPLTPTRLVAVTAESGNAALSAKLASAFAKAFVQQRTQAARATARTSLRVVRAQLATFGQPQAKASAGVDFLSSTFLSLTQQVATLEETAATGNGGYTLLAGAVTPTAPFSPQPVRNAIIGFGIGLLTALILVILLHRFAPRVSGEPEVVSLLSLPILGRLSRPGDEQPETGRLVSLAAPASSAAEAYRRLRASLSDALASGDVRTLLFASACAGEGTSAALANVAVALARTGRRVVLIDADLRSPSLHKYFGLPNDAGVTSVVAGRMSLSTALHSVDVALERESVDGSLATGVGGPPASLDVLTSGPSVLDPGELVAGQAMPDVLAELRKSADVVLVDSPGLLATADVASLASIVDGLIFVVDARVASRRALRQSRESLDLLPCHLVGIVLTRRRGALLTLHRRRDRESQPAQSESPETSAARSLSVERGGSQ